MAAPTITAKQIPIGLKMGDGFPTTLTWASKPGIQIFEDSTKPPGVDGGEAIQTSTHYNVKWHSFQPRVLLKSDPITISGPYDPKKLTDIYNLVNVQDSLTVTLPEGTTISFYGWLMKVEFSDHKEGEEPKITATIFVSNWDYINNVEQGPVVTPTAGS